MHQAEIITTEELAEWINQDKQMTLLDVLDESSFVCGHVPKAHHACVYEIVFVDTVRRLAPDLKAPLVVYATAQGSKAAYRAAEKLLGAGYSNLFIYEAGLDGWTDSGRPLEGRGGSPEMVIQDRLYSVDTEQSQVLWAGRNANVRHNGQVSVSKGFLLFENGQLSKGEIEVDLKTMKNFNLIDAALSAMLIGHLQSDDFLDMKNHPLARFVLTQAKPIRSARPGQLNVSLLGKMFIRGVERELELKGIIEAKEDGSVALETHFDLERNLFGVDYGSGTLYQRLGKHLVHDLISLEARIVAR